MKEIQFRFETKAQEHDKSLKKCQTREKCETHEVINQLTLRKKMSDKIFGAQNLIVIWVDWSCQVKVILLSIHVICGQKVIY